MKQFTILFIIKGKKILLPMKKRGFGAGRYNGVGGKVEANETITQAVIRECQEEIPVTPTTYHKVAEIFFDEQHLGKKEIIKVSAFLCQKWQGEPRESEEMKPFWFNQDNIPYEQMWADDPHWLPQILNSKLLKCRFVLGAKDQVIDKQVQVVGGF